jgi:integrase
VVRRHDDELAMRRGAVDIPHALRIKMPKAATPLAWQYLFPAPRPCTAPATGRRVLYPPHETSVQKAVHDAARAAKIEEHASCNTLRRSFATHLLAAGTDIRIRPLQTLLGHKDVRTTRITTHLVDLGPLSVASPLDSREPTAPPADGQRRAARPRASDQRRESPSLATVRPHHRTAW